MPWVETGGDYASRGPVHSRIERAQRARRARLLQRGLRCRRGTSDACRRPEEAVKRLSEALNYLCEYSIKQGYDYKFALEAKPNEPRANIYMYMPTTGAYLAFIETLAHPGMVDLT
jgi:hypothetical protein